MIFLCGDTANPHVPRYILISNMPQRGSKFMTVQNMFAEANDRIRHETPISNEEMDSMVEYVLETKSFQPGTHPDWAYPIHSATFNFIKQVDGATGVMRSRSWTKIPDIPPQALIYCLVDCKTRMGFDKYYNRFEVSKSVEPGLDVLISEVDAPIGISNREFVEWRRCLLPAPTCGKEASQYIIYLRSCDDHECSATVRPSTKKVQRAEVWMSGYVIQWWIDDEGHVLGSELLVMSQIDGKGSIPKFVVNAASSSGPAKWSASLVEAAKKLCAAKKIDIKMSNEDIDRILEVRTRLLPSLVPLQSN